MRKTPSISKPESESAKDIDAEASAFSTLRKLWPYIWPANRSDLKKRVALAVAALTAGKIVNVLTPYFFKWATDALTDSNAPDGVGVLGWLSIPVLLVASYGLARITKCRV